MAVSAVMVVMEAMVETQHSGAHIADGLAVAVPAVMAVMVALAVL